MKLYTKAQTVDAIVYRAVQGGFAITAEEAAELPEAIMADLLFQLQEAGWSVNDTCLANTSSQYAEVSKDAFPDFDDDRNGQEICEIKVRVANHGQLYDADFSIDPQTGLTVAEVLALCEKKYDEFKKEIQ